MSEASKTRRVFLLGNPHKTEAGVAFEELRSFAESRCQIVGAQLGLECEAAVEGLAHRIVVVGGDGTLIGAARSLGADQIPLIGVNVGKLGFLTEFSVDELKSGFDQALCDDEVISRRKILEVTVRRDGGVNHHSLAVNDCVIQAGPPFRLVTLGVSIDSDHLTEVSGDGLIVCTPSGSTAHNLSAGGPIMQPGVDAIVLTPMNPHSLTHRPIVIERDAVIDIVASAVNERTAAIIDGQVLCGLSNGDRVTIKRFSADFMVVRNPLYASWHKLVTKLHWGQAPDYI